MRYLLICHSDVDFVVSFDGYIETQSGLNAIGRSLDSGLKAMGWFESNEIRVIMS